jgi:hypothetical protein
LLPKRSPPPNAVFYGYYYWVDGPVEKPSKSSRPPEEPK